MGWGTDRRASCRLVALTSLECVGEISGMHQGGRLLADFM